MKNVGAFFDQRNTVWCVHCTAVLAQVETNRDHVPSKCLLPRPLPPNVPIIEICKRCNTSFSADEEYFAGVLGAVRAGSLTPDPNDFPEAARILRGNNELQRQLQLAMKGPQLDLFESSLPFTLYPDMARIKRVVLKNARGHAFFEYGEPMLNEPAVISVQPLMSLDSDCRAAFESANLPGSFAAYPEVGSRMLERAFTGIDLVEGWVIVAAGRYRYVVDQFGGLRVRTVVYDYLATEVIWCD